MQRREGIFTISDSHNHSDVFAVDATFFPTLPSCTIQFGYITHIVLLFLPFPLLVSLFCASPPVIDCTFCDSTHSRPLGRIAILSFRLLLLLLLHSFVSPLPAVVVETCCSQFTESHTNACKLSALSLCNYAHCKWQSEEREQMKRTTPTTHSFIRQFSLCSIHVVLVVVVVARGRGLQGEGTTQQWCTIVNRE
jgi:hypothetical protein